MIKPFKIKLIREETDGSKTVFFSVRKVTQLTETKKRSDEFHAALHMSADTDPDEFVYDYLKKGGWIDA